jgi:hypothetical protein
MSLNLLDNAAANLLVAPSTPEPIDLNAPTTTVAEPRAPVALGILRKPGAQALSKAGGGDRLAELPMVRMRSIVSTGERGASAQMTQGARARLAVPDLRVPQGSAGGTVLRGLFPPGSVLVRTSSAGPPPLQGYRPTGESLVAIEAAFTPQRIDAFGALGNEQRVLARSLLADLLPRLQAGTIGEAEFNLGVGLVLQAARNYAPPTEAVSQPPARAASPPAGTPVIGDSPQGTRAETPVPAQPLPVARAVAPTASVPAWSNERIRDAVTTLAEQRGITRPAAIEVMVDILQHPASTAAQRGERLGVSEQMISHHSLFIQKALKLPNERGRLRTHLARLTGMPLATVVSRIGGEGDPQLGSKVIDRIPASHREEIARRLLSVMPGSKLELIMYRTLEKMFTSDPLGGDQVSRKAGAMGTLFGLFSNDRIEMFRMMGFDAVQILSMNPVGRELAQRLDPALGKYSAAEAAARKAKGLPTTRDEAAMRLMTARAASDKPMSYRQWVAVGLLSDKPWSLPQDLNNAYLSVAPAGSAVAGQNDATLAFRVVEQIRGKAIPRGAQPELMDRDYREDINRLLLKTFGLGATRLSTGRLESIPTAFEPRSRPNAGESGERSVQRATQEPREVQSLEWSQLLPLLRRPTR